MSLTDELRHIAFEKAYAASVGYTVGYLHDRGIWSGKCHCGCGGFYMREGRMRMETLPDGRKVSILTAAPILYSHPNGFPRTRRALDY